MEFWKKNLFTLWGTEFLVSVGMSMVLPFLPFYIRQLGVTELHEVEKWSGLIYAAPFFMSVFTAPLWGWLGDRYGRRLMLLRAIAGYSLSTFLMGFAQTAEQLFFLRLLQGAVSGFITATLAIITTSTPRPHMGYALGIIQTSLTAGTIFGPFLGGILADWIGYRNIFFLGGGGGGLVGLGLVFWLVRESGGASVQRTEGGWLDNYRFVFTSSSLSLIFAANLAIQCALMSVQPVLSLFVEKLWPNTRQVATVAGAVFALTGLASLLSAPFWGKRGGRQGYKRVLIVTLLGTGLTAAPQGFVFQLYQLLFLRFLHGIFIGGVMPALYTLTALHIPEERRGGILGVTRSGLLLGNIVGPITGGYLAAAQGIPIVFLFTSLILIATTLGAVRILKEPSP